MHDPAVTMVWLRDMKRMNCQNSGERFRHYILIVLINVGCLRDVTGVSPAGAADILLQ